ncbi:MAG: hypothetical protein ABFD86_20775 [Bryobacteraceae bacterium]
MLSVGFIMRVFSYLYNAILAFFLLGVSSLAWGSGQHNLNIGILPWEKASLTYWMFALGVVAVLTTLASIFGKAKIVYFLWNLLVLVMLVKGFVFSKYTFTDPAQIKLASWLIGLTLLANIGAWFAWRAKPARA